MTEPTQMPMCPMAETCKGMMHKRFSGFALIVPGIVFIVLGIVIVIVIEPRILVWLVAMLFFAMGGMMLMMAGIIRKISARMHGG